MIRRAHRLTALAGLVAVVSTIGVVTASSPSGARALVSSPRGPAADVSEKLTAGNGVFIASSVAGLGSGAAYDVETERVAEGTATSYRARGELEADGRWTLEPDSSAPYRTRILVRRPATAAGFNGTVVVEWLNVSGGVDADPEFINTAEELVRRGYAWVGVSAQRIGVMGGPVLVSAPGGEGIAGRGLVGIDPERYGTLEHPGDGFSFDMFTQVARALRRSVKGGVLGPLDPERIIAAGQSQSAIALVTYVNGVQPQTRAFDGFLIHSRGGAALPLVGPEENADLASSIASTPTIVRTDTKVPVIVVQSESDVGPPLNSLGARQPDSRSFRLWEVAGTAHADTHIIGSTVDSLDCGATVNDGPMHVVVKAAVRRLDSWVRTGEAPPKARRLAIDADDAIVRDAAGIARAGVRTPPVDVPVVVLSSQPGPAPSVLCLLLGSTTPMTAEQLATRYDSAAQYRRQYVRDTDATIDAGFALRADRKALLAYSDPSLVPGGRG